MGILRMVIIVVVVLCAFYYVSNSGQTEGLVRRELSLNNDWQFSLDSLHWETISLPHIPRIEPLIVTDQWQGNCWYRKTIDWDGSKGKRFVRFEGVMHQADAWFNGLFLKEHIGGFLPFTVDITPHLRKGSNSLLLRVNNENNADIPPGKPLDGLDFNYYGGIYRDVELFVTSEVYITDPVYAGKAGSGGIKISFDKVNATIANGNLQVHVQNDNDDGSEIYFEAELACKASPGIRVKSEEKWIEPLSDTELNATIQVEDPFLWHPHSPELYQLIVKVYADGDLSDEITTEIGIRSYELNEDGFYLNGEKFFINGTNRHQEYPYVGYALPDNAHIRDAIKIKNAGFDMVRLSHYPQDEAFLEACDEIGLIVMNAIPGWQFFKEGEFINNSFQDARDLIRRDRNHASVLFWELSLNESDMPDEYILKMDEILSEEMQETPALSAGWVDHLSYDLYIPARQHGKPPHYWNLYKEGKRKVFIAEYGDWEYYAHNAGFNQQEFNDLQEGERTSRQLRKHGEKRLLQQALNFQEAANSNRKGSGTIGHANWVMFDYNRGYAPDLEASGLSDIFRIPKFSYHFYRSQRAPDQISDDLRISIGPMVKLASYWTEQSKTRIKVYSNCEEVGLFLNSQLIARKQCVPDRYSSNLDYPPCEFDLKSFKPGTLKAIGYINGKPAAIDSVSTAQEASKIELSIDTGEVPIARYKTDLVFLYAHIKDSLGTTLPYDSSFVNFEVVGGNAELIGTNPVRAEAGIATILLKTASLDEEITVNATSTANLTWDSLTLGVDSSLGTGQ